MKIENDVAAVADNNGFELVSSERIVEIDGFAHYMRHKKSQARLIFLENDDNNKAFSIAFKTPPKDSTGVFHILEHSVLCGSERYPLKEPFVNLLKSSMQTFLNAMTFPDKTVYPVASTNEQDLENLMNVYMDAVFNPQIYFKREIFEQEGWHFETTDDGKLDFSGVVYNEMRGALSDPSSVMMDELCACLYPGTAYSEESGGIPSQIPTLTYEEFIDEHKRHYVASNSYITLYGNLDLDRFLKILDNDYLSKQDCEPTQSQNPLLRARETCGEIKQVEMATTKQAACAALAFKIGDITDVIKCEMVDIVLDALMSSNVSPLKKRLLESGLADDYLATTYEPVLEPCLVIGMQGMKDSGKLAKFEEVLKQAVHDLLEAGLDHELIEASINHSELVTREHNFGVADGVTYSLDLLSTWLYDDDKPYDGLCYERVFSEAREELKRGGFEKILQEIILDNNDVARVEIVPTDDVRNEMPDGYGRELARDEVEKIEDCVDKLNKFQSKPDAEEDLAKLPYLSKNDIENSFVRASTVISQRGGLQVISHLDLPVRGLNYYNLYFDISHIDQELIPWLSLLALFLGKFDSDDFTAEEILLESKKWCGSSTFSSVVASNIHDNKTSLMMKCSTSCLEGNDSHVFALLSSIFNTTDFSDDEKIMQIVAQAKLGMEQSIINAGHSFAIRRSESHFHVARLLQEKLSGISFYMFLNELSENIEEKLPTIKQKLRAIKDLLCLDSSLTFSHTCSDDVAAKMIDRLGIASKNYDKSGIELELASPDREAFAVKSDVTYTALRYNLNTSGDFEPLAGVWPVLSRALSYDYLWNTIRVQGGAYGCGFNVSHSGECGFYTYRDPNVKSSIERFNDAGAWIREFSPSNREFDGLIVSTVAGLDEPKKALQRMNRADNQFFLGIRDDEMEGRRESVLTLKLEDLRERASDVSLIAESGAICSVGNKDILVESGEYDSIVDL